MPMNSRLVRDELIPQFIRGELPRMGMTPRDRKRIVRFLNTLSFNLRKRGGNKRALPKRKGDSATWPEREDMFRYWLQQHDAGNPDNLDNQEIARMFGMDGGRLSEVINGKNNPEFDRIADEVRQRVCMEETGLPWDVWFVVPCEAPL